LARVQLVEDSDVTVAGLNCGVHAGGRDGKITSEVTLSLVGEANAAPLPREAVGTLDGDSFLQSDHVTAGRCTGGYVKLVA